MNGPRGVGHTHGTAGQVFLYQFQSDAHPSAPGKCLYTRNSVVFKVWQVVSIRKFGRKLDEILVSVYGEVLVIQLLPFIS